MAFGAAERMVSLRGCRWLWASRNGLQLLTAVALVVGSTQGAQNILVNGSMEAGQGQAGLDQRVPASWVRFGSVVERSNEANLSPLGSGFALKAFSSDPREGAYQDVAVTPGDSVTAGASLYSRSLDRISGDARAGIILEFINNRGGTIGASRAVIGMDSSSAADMWIPVTIGPAPAPLGAIGARLTCFWTWDGSARGSAFWDAAFLRVLDGPNLLLNPDFEEAGRTGEGQANPFGIDGWTGFNDQGRSETTAFEGNASLLVGTGAAYSGLVQNMRSAVGGERLLLKARLFQPPDDPLTGDTRAGIKLEFFDPVSGGLPPPVENLAVGSSFALDEWQLVRIHPKGLAVPDRASAADIVIIFVGDANGGGAVYFDQAFASTTGTNLLANPSFEEGEGGFITHWQEFGSEDATAEQNFFEVEAVQGAAVLKTSGYSITGVLQRIPVRPGATLRVSAQALVSAVNPLQGSTVAGVKVQWAGSENIPPHVDITTSPSDNTIFPGSAEGEWLPLFIDYTMPSNTVAGTRFTTIVAAEGEGSGKVYYDACEAVILNRFNGSDWDGDDDEDLRDFAALQNCFTGPMPTELGWNFEVFDLDRDRNVDHGDFDVFQSFWPQQ